METSCNMRRRLGMVQRGGQIPTSLCSRHVWCLASQLVTFLVRCIFFFSLQHLGDQHSPEFSLRSRRYHDRQPTASTKVKRPKP
jgi:hypothetical protein